MAGVTSSWSDREDMQLLKHCVRTSDKFMDAAAAQGRPCVELSCAVPSLHPGQEEGWAPTSWLPLQQEKAVMSAIGQQPMHKQRHTGREGQQCELQQEAVVAWPASKPGLCEQEGANMLCQQHAPCICGQ